MKIIYVSPYPPLRDGIGSYTQLLAGSVCNEGNEIAVVTPHAVRNAPTEVIASVALAGSAFAQLRDAIARAVPDIVHVQFAVAAFGPRLAALLRLLSILQRDPDRAVVVTMHELTRDTAVLGVAGRAIYKWVAARCDHVIVHTEIARRMLVAELGVPGAKVSVIPHYSAHPTAAPATVTEAELRTCYGLADSRVLLAFGFVHVDKGLDDLVLALGILRARDNGCLTNLRLVIAGGVRPRRGLFRILEQRDNLYQARIRRLVKREALRQVVVLTGYVPDGEVAPWFGIADAVVLAYRRSEQSGVVGLAQSFDVPLLISTAGGLTEQVGATRWSFPPKSPNRIADVLQEYLTAGHVEHSAPLPVDPTTDLSAVTARTLEVYNLALAHRSGTMSYVA